MSLHMLVINQGTVSPILFIQSDTGRFIQEQALIYESFDDAIINMGY